MAAVVDERLSHAAVRVLAVLGGYANAERLAWPSVETIADWLKIERRTVFHHLKHLRELGYIQVHNRQKYAGGGKGTNIYRLSYPPVPRMPDRRDRNGPMGSVERLGEGGPAIEGPEPPSDAPKANGANMTSGVTMGDEIGNACGQVDPSAGENPPAEDGHGVNGLHSMVSADCTAWCHPVSPKYPNEHPKLICPASRTHTRASGGAGLRSFEDAEPREPSAALERALRSQIGDIEARWLVILDAMDLGNGRFEAWGQDALRGTLDVGAMLQELREAKRLAS